MNLEVIANEIEESLQGKFKQIEKTADFNQRKVIKAMQKNRLSDTHFAGTTGYGYDDIGREVLDKIYADVFKAESALVRHQIVSGTHALTVCLFGCLRPGDRMVAVTGAPYDTLAEVIGTRGEGQGSLKDFGVSYAQVDLKDNKPDYQLIAKALETDTKLVLLQRSKGYEWRDALTIEEIGKLCEFIKNISPGTIILVDNCYGEFVEEREPLEVGADIIAGSLIKNPGGGLALSGGYVAGKKEYVELVSYRTTAPGIGAEVGATLGNTRLILQGFFIAPHIVSESLKGVVFCAKMMESLGYETSPKSDGVRGDINQAIKFGNKDALIDFCQGIQAASPVDSYVSPVPWDMPGYSHPVIMAAGAFVQGSSIELSADAPIREPYIAYMQGGLTFAHIKYSVIMALDRMIENGNLKNG